MKWLFTDFDGTLRNSKDNENRIAKEDLEYVKNLQQKGHKIIISTGRPFEHISEHIKTNYEDFLPDYYLTNAGAAVYDNKGNELYAKYLEAEQTKEIIKFVKENRSEVLSFVYSFKGEENFFYYDLWKDEMVKTFMGMTPQNKPFSYIDGKEIICFKMGCTIETWNRLLNQLNKKGLKFSFVSNNLKEITFNEIHHYEVSKGNAIREMMKQLNINENDVIVAGDDNNDLSMFKEFYKNSYIVKQPHNIKIRNQAKNIIEKLSDIKID